MSNRTAWDWDKKRRWDEMYHELRNDPPPSPATPDQREQKRREYLLERIAEHRALEHLAGQWRSDGWELTLDCHANGLFHTHSLKQTLPDGATVEMRWTTNFAQWGKQDRITSYIEVPGALEKSQDMATFTNYQGGTASIIAGLEKLRARSVQSLKSIRDDAAKRGPSRYSYDRR